MTHNIFKAKLMISILVIVMASCQTKEKDYGVKEIGSKKEVLLIGTFHYNNPGADVAKTKSFDILKSEAQDELEKMAKKIGEYKPTRIFVEWEYDEQKDLDSLYRLYQDGIYFDNPELSNFYQKNEIFQLAFRVADMLDLKQVYGIDYDGTSFPFDSMMHVVSQSEQEHLQTEIQQMIQDFTEGFDQKIEEGSSLINLTRYLNTDSFFRLSNHIHCEIPLLVGPVDNFIGPFLTSEWYKRNLYMWSMIQKITSDSDQRIMVLLGSSHAAVINEFVAMNPEWKSIRFNDIFGSDIPK
ncbi:MAG: hypothetical protein KDC53_17750 [Saprospiraceae bacterium]|nr:hypothetical protein [Saprospiraceae bacterium]